MSRKPSFEEALRQKMSEVQVPDENASWQKMNALLDEKEKRRSFFFFRYEKIVGGALLLCALLLWLGSSRYMQKKAAKPVAYQINTTTGEHEQASSPNQAQPENSNDKTNGKTNKEQIYDDTISVINNKASDAPGSFPKSNKFLPEKSNRKIITRQDDEKGKAFAFESDLIAANRKRIAKPNHDNLQKQQDNTITVSSTKPEQQITIHRDSSVLINESDSINVSSSVKNNDSVAVTMKANLKSDSVVSNNQSEAAATVHATRRGSYFVDAGIGFSQQLPVDSQQFNGYNSNGKQLWIGDYIPSFYIRLEKEKKWFLQGEFHYAAPRLVKPFVYRQKTQVDYSHSNIKADKYYLQKVWYNEMPLSLNVYLGSSWSAGVGVMYNRLHGASVKKTLSSYDALSGQYTDSAARMPWRSFTDSFLYKTNTSLLLQTDYAVKRWSFGIKYSYDLQPYMTFTLPDGNVKDKKNQSLEVLIRYRFYRSGKFRIGKL